MKNFKLVWFSVLFFVFLFGFSQNQNTKDKNFASTTSKDLFFETDVVDYGVIYQNSDGHRVFKFTNKGDKPLIIFKVKGSCGCTVATKPEKPIMPGETAEIKVNYDTKRLGKFSKSITISSNSNTPKQILHIKGEVIKNKTS